MDALRIYTTETTHQEFKCGLLDWQKAITWKNTNLRPTADNLPSAMNQYNQMRNSTKSVPKIYKAAHRELNYEMWFS